LLASTGLLNDLHEARLQLLDGWNVTGEDTHFTGLSGNVDLNAATESVCYGVSTLFPSADCGATYTSWDL